MIAPFGQPLTARADRVDRVDRLKPLTVHKECTSLATKKYPVRISRSISRDKFTSHADPEHTHPYLWSQHV